MLSYIWHFILKKLYKRSMVRVVVLDKTNYTFYDKLEPFCMFEVGTNLGDFVFKFKEDRRKRYLSTRGIGSFISSYIVELTPPESLEPTEMDLRDKFVLAIKVHLFKTNYEVLAEVLMDLYLDKMLYNS